MRSARTRQWLLLIILILTVAVVTGLRSEAEEHKPDGHDHEQHGHRHDVPGHNHDEPDHAKDRHAGSGHQEAPLPGQVLLTPAAVKEAGIETAPAISGYLDKQVQVTGEIVFNEERLARVRSRIPGRVVRIVADYGQAVKPGGVLAVIDSVELAQVQMASRQAAARLNAAQKSYDRACQLYEGKAISLAELQERQARLEVEQADLENARSRLRLLGAGGALPKGSQPQESGSTFALSSPIAGRVVDRKITPGLVVKEDDELFTVADTSTLWCFVQIPENNLTQVKVGSPAIVRADALPADQFNGTIDYLADLVDKDSRTVRARIRVGNPQNRLKAGMFATIALAEGRRQALSVPESAILSAAGEPFVFVQKCPGTYQKQPVKTGAKGGGRIEVLAGLQGGEPVVVQGGFTLKSELEKSGSRGGLGGTCSGHAH